MNWDLKLSGDTSTARTPARRADVAVTGDRITAVGDLAGSPPRAPSIARARP
jgi:hypothetical protein